MTTATMTEITPSDALSLFRVGTRWIYERATDDGKTGRPVTVEDANDDRIVFRVTDRPRGHFRHVFRNMLGERDPDTLKYPMSDCTYWRFDGGIEIRSEDHDSIARYLSV